jgi:hypothetical protein
MRTILDEVDPADIEPSFKNIFRKLQRGKVLEPMIFMNRCYLISIDGTGYFSSNKIHCDSYCMKTSSKTGEITYQHQMLGVAIVHPDMDEIAYRMLAFVHEPAGRGLTRSDREDAFCADALAYR